MNIEYIQKGKYFPFIHIFRCFYFNYIDILDVEDWCKKNTDGDWQRLVTVYNQDLFEPFFFDLILLEDSDAILFKLIWC
jgi:hypothetical protein